MTTATLASLIERAEKLDDTALVSTYQRARKRILDGKNVDGLSTDDSLRFCGTLRQMVQDRLSGESEQKESEDSIMGRLMKDVPGLTEAQAKDYLSRHPNPYGRLNQQGVRQVPVTAQDVASDAAEGHSDSAPEQRIVERTGPWGR